MGKYNVNHNLWHGHNRRRLRAPLSLFAFALGILNLAAGWLVLIDWIH